MKYGEWLNEWLASTVKPLKKATTFQKYDGIAKQLLIPELGGYEINLLSASVLQNFAARLTKKYAANTVNGIIGVLKKSLERAEKTGVAERQYAGCIQYPKSREKQVECLTASEQKKIERYIVSCKKHKLYGILLCLYTGLRVGELLALKWTDVDLRRGVIEVNKTCHDSWENGKYTKIIDSPKTLSSNRVIPVPKSIIPFLKEMKEHGKGPYCINGRCGREISVRSYQRTFELLLVKLKIPHKGFHCLRHTFATRAIECGMDVKTLSEILGHNNPAVTLKRYVHSLMEHKCAMMNKLGKILQ